MIRLVGVTPEKARSFDEVKTQIETELRRQKVGQKFAAAADQFQNLVYEQADSLAPVAKALGLTVQTSPLVTRAQAQQIALGSAKLVQALFSPESIAAKRNTEAIEVGNGAMMAARIVEYKPSAVRPFDDVKAEIHRQLVRQAASELAQKAGREKLALLEQGKSDKDVGVAFSKPVTLLRNQPQPGFTNEAITRIFQADTAKLPAYVGTAERPRRLLDLPAREGDHADGSRSRQGRGGACANRRDAESRAVRRLRQHAEGQGQGRDQPGQSREEVGPCRAACRGRRAPRLSWQDCSGSSP